MLCGLIEGACLCRYYLVIITMFAADRATYRATWSKQSEQLGGNPSNKKESPTNFEPSFSTAVFMCCGKTQIRIILDSMCVIVLVP